MPKLKSAALSTPERNFGTRAAETDRCVAAVDAAAMDDAAHLTERGGRPRRRARRPKILIVGQTPPPYGGQALMIEQLVRASFAEITTYHVRMGFSDSMRSLGRVRAGKLLHLGAVIGRALALRFRYRIPILYYPPAGPTPAAVVRDIIILSMLRPFFRKVVFHFHAAGLSDYLAAMPAGIRWLARHAYGRPHAAIQTSALARPDAAFFGSRQLAIIANGLADAALPYLHELDARRGSGDRVHVLFVGAISEIKGTMRLLEAARELASRRSDFALWFMGEFISSAYEREVREFCRVNSLDTIVTFLGMRVDDQKWQIFRDADVVCLPSYLESFGNVLVEAMIFQLPVVATRVGGIPDIVEPEVTGCLLSGHDPGELAGALERLISDRALRERMGYEGRRRYLERFTLAEHLRRMEEYLYDVSMS